MRFLHTADWHVGKTLFGRSRLDEQQRVVAEMADIVKRERVDCVLLAGDVFESTTPSGESERLVCDALAEFAGLGAAVILAGGNHDHPRRLAALRNIGNPLRIFVRPDVASASEGGVISLCCNAVNAQIAVLPWMPGHKAVELCRMLNPEENCFDVYSDNVESICRHLTHEFEPNSIHILLAHLFVFGSETSGSERAVHVSHPFAVRPAQLPRSPQYIALGHLHKPQEVPSESRCLYSGSPLQLDFGERGQEKRVVIAHLAAGKPPKIESIPLRAGRELREVTTTLDSLHLIAESCGDAYLKVTVRAGTRISGLSQQVSDILPNALIVQQESLRKNAEARDERPKDPAALFRDYLLDERNTRVSDEMIARFSRLYDEAKHAPDPD